MNLVPTSTSSSGKASTARRNWSAVTALSTESRLAPRLIDASPHNRHGVPPMRSSVQNEKPWSLPTSRAWVMSTHSSRCFDSSPISNPAGRSVQMSAMSASSASLNAVQSLVSTSIAMSCVSLLTDLTGWSTRLRGFGRSVPKTARSEQHPQLGEQPVAGLDRERRRQADHLAPHVEEDRRRPRVLLQQALELIHPRLGEGVDGDLEVERVDALQHQGGPLELHAHQLRRLVAQVEPALDAHHRVVGEEVADLGHGPREHPHLEGGFEVLQGEGGHELTPLGVLAGQAGDHTAHPAKLALPTLTQLGQGHLRVPPESRLRTDEGVVAHVQAEHLLLE